MAQRRSREQWEQDLRDAQAMAWTRPERKRQAIIRLLPAGFGFKNKRQLFLFVLCVIAVVATVLGLTHLLARLN